MSGGGTTVNVPGPSEEERALQATQNEILLRQQEITERQIRQQDLLAPFLFEEAGIIPQFDESGEIIGFDVDPDAEVRRESRLEIEDLLIERSRAALAGELPVNPALERELGQAKEDLNERLRKQLGPGFATSTPGIEALDTLFRSSEELREGARRGDLTLAEQLGLARQTTGEAGSNDFITRLLGINQAPFAANQQFSNILGGLHTLEGSFASQRQLETQGLIASAQNRASTIGSLFGAAGSAAGIFAGIKFSSRKVKHSEVSINVDDILEALDKLHVYKWEYTDEIGIPGIHIGPYAEDFSEIMEVGDPAGEGIYPIDGIGALIASVQALSRRVRELEARDAPQ